MFGAGSGVRQNARKVLVLLTDGEQSAVSGSVSPSVAVMPFHKDKIKVLVIGIGPAVNSKELMSIVAKPDYFYPAQDFNELKSGAFISQIIDASCEIFGKLQIIRCRIRKAWPNIFYRITLIFQMQTQLKESA